MPTKAVILAGGMGTRLSEETVVRPKPMIEIGGKPILWHIMKSYSAHGVNDFVICLGYKGYLIKEYFANYFLHTSDVTFDMAQNKMEVHQRYAEPWRVTLVDTGDQTQTGGRSETRPAVPRPGRGTVLFHLRRRCRRRRHHRSVDIPSPPRQTRHRHHPSSPPAGSAPSNWPATASPASSKNPTAMGPGSTAVTSCCHRPSSTASTDPPRCGKTRTPAGTGTRGATGRLPARKVLAADGPRCGTKITWKNCGPPTPPRGRCGRDAGVVERPDRFGDRPSPVSRGRGCACCCSRFGATRRRLFTAGTRVESEPVRVGAITKGRPIGRR